MRIRYSFRSEKGMLPDATTLMETTRKLHNEIKKNPSKFWIKYEEWIKPMNQLQNGLFISINQDSEDFKFVEYCDEESDIKLEFTQLGFNYVKIMFNYTGTIPYRVSSE